MKLASYETRDHLPPPEKVTMMTYASNNNGLFITR
jgi:hypothetical protein